MNLTTEEQEQLVRTARTFVDKANRINTSPEFNSIWAFAFTHGMIYKGEDYKKELEDLEAILKQIELKEKK
jgi:hypothetical protein